MSDQQIIKNILLNFQKNFVIEINSIFENYLKKYSAIKKKSRIILNIFFGLTTIFLFPSE